jgi:hypothetical protein
MRHLEQTALLFVGIPALLAVIIACTPKAKTGLYRYIASPMQVSGALVLVAGGALLRNMPLVLGGPVVIMYGIGLANWHEGVEMRRRFGESWTRYRSAVPAWRPRWQPWHPVDAPVPRLYIAEGCGLCRGVRRWFESHGPVALVLEAAEDHPERDLTRMTYEPMDGTPPEEGVAAFARGLEHINLAWALLGAGLRLPFVCSLAQILADTAGFDPQLIERRRCAWDEKPTT